MSHVAIVRGFSSRPPFVQLSRAEFIVSHPVCSQKRALPQEPKVLLLLLLLVLLLFVFLFLILLLIIIIIIITARFSSPNERSGWASTLVDAWLLFLLHVSFWLSVFPS